MNHSCLFTKVILYYKMRNKGKMDGKVNVKETGYNPEVN